MGNLWYVREGSNPTYGGPCCQLSFSKIQELFSKYKIKYLGAGTPRFLSSNPALDDYRPPQYVVFELPTGEPTGLTPNRIGFQPETSDGFYQIDVSIEQCEAILAEEQL